MDKVSRAAEGPLLQNAVHGDGFTFLAGRYKTGIDSVQCISSLKSKRLHKVNIRISDGF